MELIIDRDVKTKNSTIGTLYVDGKFECFILEDHDRGLNANMELSVIKSVKVKGETAIPTGRYEVIITFSNRFQKDLPEVLGVKGFDKIRLHSGNTKNDTEGCPLLGMERGIDFVGRSREAFAAFFPKMQKAIARGEKVFLTVKD
jgi:hypothetical protein